MKKIARLFNLLEMTYTDVDISFMNSVYTTFHEDADFVLIGTEVKKGRYNFQIYLV